MNIFAELEAGVVAISADDMKALAARIARELPADRVLALSGDLGAGKTTFVQGLAATWHVREAVTSPSFTVCNLHRGTRLLVHVDAYRLSGIREWEGLMIEEFLRPPWCLVIEWPERVREAIPPDAIWLHIEMLADGSRTVRKQGAPPGAGRMAPASPD